MDPIPAPLLDDTLRSLESPEAEASIARSAYWPKWDSPWWRMLLLHELGLSARIPDRSVRAMTRAMQQLPQVFPSAVEDVPAGVDPSDIPCHCQLGCMYPVLAAAGVDVDRELPWIRPWFVRYQLPDGGLNCDEAAYARPVPRSSFLSTLPPLEAI